MGTEKEANNSSGDLKYCALYIAEPGFATKLFDHDYTMKGLSYALQANNLASKVEQVIFQGGVIPHVPPYTSVSYLNDLKLLGNIKKNGEEEKTLADILLEKRLPDSYSKQYYKTKINTEKERKINSLEEAFEVAGEQIKILSNVLPKETVFTIQVGEEDRKNIKYMEMNKIKKAADEKKEQFKTFFGETLEAKQKLDSEFIDPFVKKYLLSKVKEDTNFQTLPHEKKEEYYFRIEKEIKKDIPKIEKELNLKRKEKDKLSKTEISDIVSKAIKYAKWAQDRKETEKRLSEFEKTIDSINSKYKALEDKLKSLDRNIDWNENLLEKNRSVSFFTNQIPITPTETEIYWASAKSEYTKKFQEWKLKQQLLVHVKPRNSFNTGDKFFIDEETGKKSKVKQREGKELFLAHNLMQAFSNSVSPRSIKEGKLELNRRNMMINKIIGKANSPDYLLLGGHDGGGFRVQPWFKESEMPEDGKFVKGQGISWLVSLPTLQDITKLEDAVNHNFTGEHVKRYLNGPYGSAAIIHTEDKNGVNRFKIWDTQTLIEWGKTASQIEMYKNSIAKDDKISPGDKERLKGTINELELKIKTNVNKIETAGDFHLGATANKDRYASDQLIEAMQIYQREHGLPELVVWDEIPNGVQRFYGAMSDYQADVSPIFKRKMEELEKRTDLNFEEKYKILKQESMKNLRSIPVFNASEQKRYFKYLLKPYADEVLSNNGKLILMSGNHYNKSQMESDEATELANQFSIEQLDLGLVKTFDGKANDIGLGSITLPSGHILYGSHKFPEKNDEIYGVMDHLRRMNNDADIVFAGDRHQTGAGYADGHIVTVHPGLQSMNKYVSAIGKPAGLRGFQNVYYDPRNKGVYEVEFVLNNTLEKIIESHKID